jgi:hypothetical protein
MHPMMWRPARRVPGVLALGVLALGPACQPDADSESTSEAVAQVEDSTAATPDPTTAETQPSPEPNTSTTAGPTPIDAEPTTAEPSELPEAPPNYGVFVFATEPPKEEALTLHGAAGYEVVAIHASPSKESEHVGFLRIGTRMRVAEKVVNDDCPRGWHALEGGGHACASRGLMVDAKPPFMSYEPAPPRVAEPFPYDWAYVRQWNTPQWWQVPNAEQLAATRELRAAREAERLALLQPPAPPPAEGGDAGAAPGEGGEVLPPPPEGDTGGGDGGQPEPAGDDGADTPPADGTDAGTTAEPEPEEPEEPIEVPFSPSMPWLEKGYFLSLGETIREGDVGFWRTARGGIVEKANAHPYDPRDFHGAELTEGMTFPVGFVMVKNGTKLLRLGDDDKLHATGKNLDKRTFLDLGEEVEISGRAYFTVIPYPPPQPSAVGESGSDHEQPEGEAEPQLLVKADVMRQPDLQPIPKGLDPWDRWIDVDITKQMLVAYEGSRPVYVTLVSTGKKGSDEEPFETPTGRFRIRSKQITSNMDGATATDGNYAIQDVPWVMYFQGSYALHGAFWHESFGYTRSHGCVNLGATDARWLFYWTTPFMPERWHGVSASEANPGTTIVIRRSPE